MHVIVIRHLPVRLFHAKYGIFIQKKISKSPTSHSSEDYSKAPFGLRIQDSDSDSDSDSRHVSQLCDISNEFRVLHG